MNATSDLAMEIQELVWALVDDQASSEQARRLEELLLEDDDARQIYTLCIQMHADLYFLLNGKKTPLPPAAPKTNRTQPPQKTSTPALPVSETPAFSAAFAP